MIRGSGYARPPQSNGENRTARTLLQVNPLGIIRSLAGNVDFVDRLRKDNILVNLRVKGYIYSYDRRYSINYLNTKINE